VTEVLETSLKFKGNKFSKTYGGMSVSLCMAYCLSNGYTVSYPLFDDARYDLIADIDNSLKRIQCKTAMVFSYKQIRYPRIKLHHGSQSSYGRSDFDLLWVITQQHAYLIPIDKIPTVDDQLVEIVLSPKFNTYIVDMPFLTGQDPKRTLETMNLTDKERARIASLFRLGDTSEDIAMTMGLKHSQVSGYLASAKIVKEHFVTDDIKSKIVELYKSGIEVKKISHQVNFSRALVTQVITDSGTELRRKTAIHPEWKQTIVEMYVKGQKPQEIAKYFGIRRPNAISAFLNKHKWLIDETRQKLGLT